MTDPGKESVTVLLMGVLILTVYLAIERAVFTFRTFELQEDMAYFHAP